jgi:hypothetical protein
VRVLDKTVQNKVVPSLPNCLSCFGAGSQVADATPDFSAAREAPVLILPGSGRSGDHVLDRIHDHYYPKTIEKQFLIGYSFLYLCREGVFMTTIPQGSTTPETGPVTLLIATRKGAWFLKGDRARRAWEIEGPVFLGHIVHHVVRDPRDPVTLLMAARTGHLGPTIFRSADGGKTWKEASKPPAFPKAPEGRKGRVVDHVFWLSPGHPSEPGVWYAGTSPQGLFRSEDQGRYLAAGRRV